MTTLLRLFLASLITLGLTLTVAAGPAVSESGTASRADGPLTGTWSGTVQGDGSPYNLRVAFSTKRGEPFARVRYQRRGDFTCTGTWTYRGREDSAVRFRERITRGSCYPGSVRLFDLQGKKLLYNYVGEDFRAVLRRP